MPPNRLMGFYWHYTRQVWPALVALMAVGFFVALIEVSIFRYIASIVDLLKALFEFVRHGIDYIGFCHYPQPVVAKRSY